MSEQCQFNVLLQPPPTAIKEIRKLLEDNSLQLETGLSQFIEARYQGKLVGCAGIDGNIIKCVAVDKCYRGGAISLRLLSEVINLAYRQGVDHLFLYTKPANVPVFEGAGFRPLVTVPGQVTMMENAPRGLASYCDGLALLRQPGNKIGSIVMNANPFTLGHLYLINQALSRCDWLHLFVVKQDASRFTYADRLRLIRAGIDGLERITVHPGSDYTISKATFPSYFLKEQGLVDECATALDLLLFRQSIATSLGINLRFAGTEPLDLVTAKYNRDMEYWLSSAEISAPVIQFEELPRIEVDGAPISASRVRKFLDEDNFTSIAKLVPASTLEFLKSQKGKL
ncbi:[citrate (pro-3S)-lyase] ligase [Citrobacter portucalensis]|uniref:[citrate (pro-3S)-lyase] ligase n=1 Tax=Citrobacter portucalensis TaxID=1639133 RepID=UPI002243A1B6|nr:[citrate (pro-3S)-lyase] ligase [Citrobacter portucalensis]MCW8353797.1 [citrate (pro-3S)-lyase] ligase [Citrobacter portucalensis]MCX8992106.1 [citrate (pro-3S)-lyase] ligase [Citrobacter portucalensis]MCX9006316.1 [citrate (pro-3S)-lyase] ligase [Citrobacter portucalensis]MCX9039148.1 [citrate (pro-3S)-lyase] ligase [Citrobacter portucalensis]MCX9053719.1 [citrate (pro-3S)-lyase] ligase [Citrobacter portucalensis]